MKLTRHNHSCIEISQGDTSIIVDPGSFGIPSSLDTADAVLITHIHPDHVDAQALTRARKLNPRLQIFGPAGLADLLDIEFRTVVDGERFRIGAIDVKVHASQHATVIRSVKVPENLGYVFDERIFHTGDSFPDLPEVECALLPISGPWMRMLDVDYYLDSNRPQTFIGIHDGNENEAGLDLRRGLLSQLAESYSLKYLPLTPSETYDFA